MLQYWKANRKSFYAFTIAGMGIFLISLFYLKNSKYPVATQLVFNILVSFGILLILWSLLFLSAYSKFRIQSTIFAGDAFATLLRNNYQVLETKPGILFLTELTIRGESKGYPVRIEYLKNKIHVVIGIREPSPALEPLLASHDLKLEPIGIIKEIDIKSLRKNDSFDLNGEIEKITAFLQEKGITKY